MDSIAIIIPCYNEKKTIKKVVTDCKYYLPEAKVYVCDNNSIDGSDEIAKNVGADVYYERKQGKGNAVRTMLRQIDAKCYVIVDADDTYDLSNIKDMCDLVLNDNIDMVVGDRLSSTYFNENKRLFHNFGNKLVLYIINKFFDTNIRDVMTGFRCLSYEFAKTFPIVSKNFEIETEMTIHAVYHNMNIQNIIIGYKDRPKDSPSKLNTIKDGVKVIKTIFSLYKNYKPFYFFSFIAFVLFAVSTVFFTPVFIEFFFTIFVSKIPTVFVCGFVYIISFLSFFTGVILSTIADNEKKEFEHKLILSNYLKKIN